MATKSRVVLTSNFAKVKRVADEFVEDAVGKALDEGEAEAEKRLERANNAFGWNLPMEIEQDRFGMDGRISYPEFYGIFFEYGSVHLPAAPFMRPAHRRMRKRFVDEMQDDFEGWIRRKAGIRRW